VELLRADFLGLPAPPLRVLGYPGLPSKPPTSLNLPGTTRVLAVPMAAAGPMGRPTRIQWGAPAQEWTFTYADSSLTEVRALREPMGASTTFTFENCPCPFPGMLLRGVNSTLTVNPEAGTSTSHTWTRTGPSMEGKRPTMLARTRQTVLQLIVT